MQQKVAKQRRILVVTPAFNAAPFIDDAITSVLVQKAPGFSICYHVQDGGSTDGTLDKLRLWEDRLKLGLFPSRDTDFQFSFASEPDGGMYDALQRGFDRLAPHDDDILTWINSDDGLSQGSLVAVLQVFNDVKDCEFLSGRIALLNEAGALIVLGQPIPYARADLAGGLHDGRALPFIMQEGTFFSGRVWTAVGGVDPRFRLAGDWDLWRRMAGIVDHFLVNSVTGFHRRRRGQLSTDMVSYYREIDGTPRPEPMGKPGDVRPGTTVNFDQSSGRWVTISYDTSRLATPALLRDGRSVNSAACRPVAGFGAPEGPYPEYGLPAGIRWMSGSSGEVDITAPRAGRYRLRLAIRVVRSGVVVGLAIASREPLPISLESPIPFVDQVIETIWWLEAGANRLFIDCGAGSASRTLLLVNCEATETDERMVRSAVLPPAGPNPYDRSGLGIAILCDDYEPELLERSIAACEQMVSSGAAVFVILGLQSAVLRLVVDFRQDLIADCFDVSRPPDGNTRSIHRTLHEAGFANVLIVQRGSLVLPRGVDAAMATLDDSGADAVFGLVDERDSTGRSLQLVDVPETGPALFRNVEGLASAAPTILIGCCLAQTTSHARDYANTPIVWLIDGDRPVLGRTPALLLAAALAMLGYDARHVISSEGVRFELPSGAMVIASTGNADMVDAQATIALAGGSLRIIPSGAGAVNLPLGIDTDLLVARGRGEARRRLGFSIGERILCMAETSEEAAATIFARIEATSGGPVRILNFGNPIATIPLDCNVIEVGTLDDLLLLSYFLSAADAAMTTVRTPSLLACAAWSCGLPVLDVDGIALTPGRAGVETFPISSPCDDAFDAKRAQSARDLVIGTGSIAALALAIHEQCAFLRTPAGSSHPLSLRSGKVPVRSYGVAGRNVGAYHGRQPAVATPLRGAVSFVAADVQGGLSLIEQTAELIVCLDRNPGSRLRLHVRGVPGDTWDIRVGERTVSFRVNESGADMLSIPGDFCTGPTRLVFARVSNDSPQFPLHIIGLEVIGEIQTPVPRWEDTMVELVPAGEQAVADLETDGDWQRISSFLDEEPAVPQEGLYAPFHWSLGDRCAVRMRVTHSGRRALRVAFSAGLRHQRIRPVVAGQAYDWSSPLTGPIGHVEYRKWVIDWLTGDVDICFELSEVLHAPGADLGIILFALTIDELEPGPSAKLSGKLQ